MKYRKTLKPDKTDEGFEEEQEQAEKEIEGRRGNSNRLAEEIMFRDSETEVPIVPGERRGTPKRN